MSGCGLSAMRTGPDTTSFEHDGGLMIMTNPGHIPTSDAMKNDLSHPTSVSTLNTPLYLWNHLFADQRGYLALFSGARGDDPQKLLACAERYFSWPEEAGSAVEAPSPSRIRAGRVTSAPTCIPRSAGSRRTLHPCAPFMRAVTERIRARASLNPPRSSNAH